MAMTVVLAFPSWAVVRSRPASENVRSAFAEMPVSWQAPIGQFLDGSIDASALYGRLLILSQQRPVLDADAALEFSAHLSAEASAADPARRIELAERYAALSSVLGGFVADEPLSHLRSEAARLAPEDRAERLLDAARRTGQALIGLRPDGAHLPAAGEFAADDDMMELRSEIDLGYIRELLPRMRFDASGAVEFGEDGFPDESSYSVAHKAAMLLRDDPEGRWVRGRDREMILRLADAYEKTEAVIFSGGNELAKTVRYIEPRAGGLNMTILRYVETGQYTQGPFWVSSNDRSMEAPEGFADVTAQTAKGPFLEILKLEEFIEKKGRRPASKQELKEFESGAKSRFFWAARPGPFGVPDVNGMRVRVNTDWKGNDRTLEVLAPVGFDPDGEVRWKGFFFKKIEGRWISGAPTKLNAAAKCINCHSREDANGKKRHTPLPEGKLKTREDYLAVGYKDTRLLDLYLKIGHRALEDWGNLILPPSIPDGNLTPGPAAP